MLPVLFAALLLVSRANGVSITVTTNADDGAGSFRDALRLVNAAASGDNSVRGLHQADGVSWLPCRTQRELPLGKPLK